METLNSLWSDGFAITPSDTLDIQEDVANYNRAPAVFIHNTGSAGTVRVMPYGKRTPVGFTLTGTSGTANITINGVAYLVTFSSSLSTTAANFVATHKKALNALNLDVFNQSGSAVLTFKGAFNPTIANATGNLAGTALARTPITVYIGQGDTHPMPVTRVYATTPTPPTGLLGMYGGPK